MEQYCISLQQAKRLKELGFEKPSQYSLYEIDSRDKVLMEKAVDLADKLLKQLES